MKYDKINTPKDLLKYMEDNINYGYVSSDGTIYNSDSINWKNWSFNCIVQDSDGILDTKYGTCWDQVELERKWFSEHNYIFKTLFMAFNINYENDLPTHTFLVFYENSKWYWFEHSFYDYKGIHEFKDLNRLIEYVKECQIRYVYKNKNIKFNSNDILVFEYDKPNKNMNVDEYLDFVTKNELKDI